MHNPYSKLYSKTNNEIKNLHNRVRLGSPWGAVWGTFNDESQRRIDKQRSNIDNLKIHTETVGIKKEKFLELSKLEKKLGYCQTWVNHTKQANKFVEPVITGGVSAKILGLISGSTDFGYTVEHTDKVHIDRLSNFNNI